MTKYKVYECELKVTQTGKELKKLILQGEGKQYPDKNVTMWSDHPLFQTIAVGQEHELDLDIKDSKVPNPHGGFYKNKTVKNVVAPAQDLQQRVANLEERMAKVEKWSETSAPDIEYPEEDVSDIPF